MTEKFYMPELGIDGSIEELVDWANKYTQDYTDEALLKISELAKERKMEEKYIQIPLLLKDERKRETEEEDSVPYERMKIDYYLYDKTSYSSSDGEGGETEIFSDRDVVIVSLTGIDEDGYWEAANSVSVKEFMSGDYNFLNKLIGETYYYGKEYR